MIFFRFGLTNRMLYILYRLNWSDLLTRGMCNMVYRVSDKMKDWNFMNLNICHMFSTFHWGRANLGCETSWFSSLVNINLRSDGFSNKGLGFWELIIGTWLKIDKMSILTAIMPLWRIAKLLINLNIIIKKFLSWKSAFSSFDRQWTVLFIWRMFSVMT